MRTYILNDCSTMSIFCVRAGCEIRMTSYAFEFKHSPQSVFDRPFVRIYCKPVYTSLFFTQLRLTTKLTYFSNLPKAKPMQRLEDLFTALLVLFVSDCSWYFPSLRCFWGSYSFKAFAVYHGTGGSMSRHEGFICPTCPLRRFRCVESCSGFGSSLSSLCFLVFF